VICSTTRFRNGTWLQLPGYPGLVLTLQQAKKQESPAVIRENMLQPRPTQFL